MTTGRQPPKAGHPRVVAASLEILAEQGDLTIDLGDGREVRCSHHDRDGLYRCAIHSGDLAAMESGK